jgi:hypothetical protein
MQRDGISMDNEHKERAEKHYEEAKIKLEDTADICAKFVLMRSGDVFISAPSLRDKILEERSIKNAKKWGRNFTKDIVDQVYFFLRDVVHKHQHHPAEDDTMLIPQDRDHAEIAWRKRILFSLYYHIIGAKRHDGTLSQVRALGVLAYANSFHENCCRRHQNCDDIPTFNDASLRSSIEARIKEDEVKEEFRQYKESKRMLVSGTSRNYSLSAVAIILALAAILVQPHINKDEKGLFPQIYLASTFVTTNFPSIVTALLVLFIFVWLATSPRILRWALGRDVLEISNTNRKASVPVILLMAIISLGLTLYFEWPLVSHYLWTVKGFLKALLGL